MDDLKLRPDEPPMFMPGWSRMRDIDAQSPVEDLRLVDASGKFQMD